MFFQVLCALLQSEKSQMPCFWIREKKQSSSEVDLVYSMNSKLIPIEVKSGTTGSLKSLHQFVERAPHHYAVRMYAGEYEVINTKTPNGKQYTLMNLKYLLSTLKILHGQLPQVKVNEGKIHSRNANNKISLREA